MKRAQVALGFFAVMALSVGCGQSPEVSDPLPSPSVNRAVGAVTLTPQQFENGKFRTKAVEQEKIAKSFQALGEFRTKNRAKSVVEAPLGGRVLGLFVEEGDSVSMGQAVIRIESPELSKLLAEYHHAEQRLSVLEANARPKILMAEQGPDTQAPLNQARTRLQNARARNQADEARLKEASLRKSRLEKLLESGIPSQEQVDQARSEYFQVLADYQASQNEEALAKEAYKSESELDRSDVRAAIQKREISSDLSLAREELRHQAELLKVLGKDADGESSVITLRASSFGSVTNITASVGEFVETGQSLMQLVRDGQVYPVIWIPSARVPEVKVGNTVTVFFSADSAGHPAKISWLAPELDSETRTLLAHLEFEEKNLSGRAGVFLKAEVALQEKRALAVPKSALTEVNGKPCVYVKSAKYVFQRRDVVLGIESTDSVEIKEGLSLGETCVTEGVFLLKSLDLRSEGE